MNGNGIESYVITQHVGYILDICGFLLKNSRNRQLILGLGGNQRERIKSSTLEG